MKGLSKYFVFLLLALIANPILEAQNRFRPRPIAPISGISYLPPVYPEKIKDIDLYQNAVFQLSWPIELTKKNRSPLYSTKLLLGRDAGHYDTNAYVKRLDIPKGNNIGVHNLRWITNAPETKCVVIQVSAIPFQREQDWKNPTGLLAEKLHCPGYIGSWKNIDMDFDNLSNYPVFSATSKPPVFVGGGGYTAVSLAVKGVVKPPKTVANQITKSPAFQVDLGLPAFPSLEHQFKKRYLHDIELQRNNITELLHSTHFLFIRVVPVNGSHFLQLTGLPSNDVVIFTNAQKPTEPTWYSSLPKISIAGHSPMQKDHRYFWCYNKVTQDLDLPFGISYKKGQVLNVCNQSDSFLDSITGMIGEIWSSIRKMVDWISSQYNALKATMTELIAEMSGCDTDFCKKVIGTCINTTLVMSGIPPTLPNSEELVELSSDYLTEVIANETGVPPELVEMGADKIKEAVSEAKNRREASHLFVPAANMQYRPFGIYLTVGRNITEAASSYATNLTIEDEKGLYQPITLVLPKNKKKIGGRYSLPIYLQPKENYRLWWEYHIKSMEQLGKMDLVGYTEYQKKADREYQRFYNKYQNAFTLKVTLSNAYEYKKALKIGCFRNGNQSWRCSPIL